MAFELHYAHEQFHLAVSRLATGAEELRERLRLAWFEGPSTVWALNVEDPHPAVPPSTEQLITNLHDLIVRVDDLDPLEERTAASLFVDIWDQLDSAVSYVTSGLADS